MQVRRGRISREMAVKLAIRYDGQFPSSYLGVSLEKVLSEIKIERVEFDKICDRFTNKKLFRIDNVGRPIHDQAGNLIKLNSDNE